MANLALTATGTKLRITNNLITVSTQVEYDTCTFTFNLAWVGYIKTAVFYSDTVAPVQVILTTDTCTIPWEVVATAGTLYIGVFGTKDDSILPTNFVTQTLVQGSHGEGSVPEPPTPEVYDTLLLVASNAEVIAQSVRDDADNGDFNGEQGIQGIQGEGVDTTARAEIADARKGKASLGDKIDDIDTELADIATDSKNTQHTLRKPIVTFISDDGSTQDIIKLKPLSVTYNIPMVAALITGQVYVSADYLYLQNTLGWEIASHTDTHPLLNTLTEAQIDTECSVSKTKLTNQGFIVKNIVYPGGGNDEKTRRIAKKYYRCGVSVNDPKGTNSGIIPSFNIKRVGLGVYFDGAVSGFPATNTLEYYKARVDQAVTEGSWLIFMLHPGDVNYDVTQQGYLEAVIQYVKSLNIDIMTLDKAFNIFGNAIEFGDYDRGLVGIAVDKDGNQANFPNNMQIISKVGKTNISPITDYPKKVISATTFLYVDNMAFPTRTGTLLTYRLDNDDDLSFQVWYDYQSEKMYRRVWHIGAWLAWSSEFVTKTYVDTSQNIQQVSKVGKSNTSPVTEFTSGVITTTSFLSGDGAGFPTNVGTLLTFRLNTDNDFNFQLWYDYASTKMYRRRWNTGAWQAWDEYLTVSTLGINQSYNINTTANVYTSAQLIGTYPNNRVTLHFVDGGAGSTGFPGAGYCTTYRIGGNGYNRQEFRKYMTNEVWSRYVSDVDGSWTTWVKISGTSAFTTANRPINKVAGYSIFDSTLSKPIWLKTAPSTWVDATGTTV